MQSYYINSRSLQSGITGTQRYAGEILARLSDRFQEISPKRVLSGVSGHLWEQFVLPTLVSDGLLWSPGNAGPLLVRNQVVSILDMSAVDHPEWFTGLFSSWYRFLLPVLARRVRHILTISEFSRDRIIQLCGVSPAKVTYTHLAAAPCFYKRSDVEIDQVKVRYSIPAEGYLLALGSLEPRKNLTRLLEAWESVRSQLPPSTWLVLAGARGKAGIFQHVPLAQLPERVHLTGYIKDEDLPALYSGAAAFIYPSIYEGFGLPPLEAMACGTPVVVSRVSSLPEVVGDAGLYIDPGEIPAIAEGIRTIFHNDKLRQELAVDGQKRAAVFSWE
ncbi:MAG: glycosyltransferase family 4 protein, partial [Anaerolineales bacterium]|nr:glycosyltransferase family 4 protein [Anaerolineales bacterium]